MRFQRNYNTNNGITKAVFLLACVIAVAAGLLIGSQGKAAQEISCWILCKPGSQVYARRTPDKGGQVVGFLEVGDVFRTTGESRNGWIRAEGIGEFGEAWIWCGYVVTDRPVAVGENYVCVAKNRVACRRWVDGPQVARSPWLKNGSSVQVFYIAGDWAVTSRGYIRTEWLEVDPV